MLGTLVLLEYLALPLQPWEYDLPFYHELAQEPGQFGIVELPLAPLAIYEGYQTIHQKPMVGGYLARQPDDPLLKKRHTRLQYLQPGTPPTIHSPRWPAAPGGPICAAPGCAMSWYTGPRSSVRARPTQTKLARVFPGVPSRTLSAEQMTVYQLAP